MNTSPNKLKQHPTSIYTQTTQNIRVYRCSSVVNSFYDGAVEAFVEAVAADSDIAGVGLQICKSF